MSKSNREKNAQHEKDQLMRVRPKQPVYDFKPLEEVVKVWVKG